MAMTTINHEIKSSNISAQKMFKAVVQESNTTYTTVFPQLIKTIETIQGDGGPETILRFYFIDSVTTELMSLEIKVDVADPLNLYAKYTMTDTNDEVVVNELKFEEEGQGCVCKLTTHYIKQDDEIHSGAERALRVYKKVLEYLSANPHICA
ncbi:unnamed protein product [Linum trigynum]|uniref:Bet v I/Major latex protein domain-containing protein n=1 Tax=Linum trigynum TaxID=586398 RepID=A0AAV2G4S8_9ROSI